MLKKGIKSLFVALCMLLISLPMSMLTACDMDSTSDIVVTSFAQYDWVRNVLGENPASLEVRYLLDNGVDMHNYLPSIQDMYAISTAKLFIYTDSDAENWISSALKNPQNKDRITLNLMSLIPREDRIALDEDSGHVHDENCDHEYDEHIWLSLKLSQNFVLQIANRLGNIDPENAELYTTNAQSYISSLISLDERYESEINKKSNRKLLFADRYPFAYMMRDYDIEVASAFSGCAADTEITFQKMLELKEYLTQNSLQYVLILENSSKAVANEIISGTSAQICRLDSMQSVTASKLNSSYLSIMESNLEVLSLVL